MPGYSNSYSNDPRWIIARFDSKDSNSDSDDGIDWQAYEKLAEEGTIGGSLFPFDGSVWFSLSN